MKRTIFILLITALFTSYTHAQDIGLPAYSPNDEIISHSSYTLKYNEQYEQAEWVAYRLTDVMISGNVNRTDNFREDPAVNTGSASLFDYKGSGYDRGHLCPAADMKFSNKAMSESFYMSNMSPQRPGFNRGIWKHLESQVRKWADDNDEIYVVTGPVLKGGNFTTIGSNEVAVPDKYYKVILDYKEPELKAIAFVLPHQKISGNLQGFAVTVDKAEEITGINFFPALPDNIEESLESSLDINKWSFKPYRKSKSSSSTSSSTRCNGITRKDYQCKRMTKNENGYCWQHQ